MGTVYWRLCRKARLRLPVYDNRVMPTTPTVMEIKLWMWTISNKHCSIANKQEEPDTKRGGVHRTGAHTGSSVNFLPFLFSGGFAFPPVQGRLSAKSAASMSMIDRAVQVAVPSVPPFIPGLWAHKIRRAYRARGDVGAYILCYRNENGHFSSYKRGSVPEDQNMCYQRSKAGRRIRRKGSRHHWQNKPSTWEQWKLHDVVPSAAWTAKTQNAVQFS